MYEHAIWSSGQTHAEAAVIQFILPSSMPALMGWLCLCVHMSVYDVQFIAKTASTAIFRSMNSLPSYKQKTISWQIEAVEKSSMPLVINGYYWWGLERLEKNVDKVCIVSSTFEDFKLLLWHKITCNRMPNKRKIRLRSRPVFQMFPFPES